MESAQTTTADYQAWTVEALAKAAEISEAYIRRMCRNNVIKAQRFGRAWFIPYAEGQRWLLDRTARSKSKTLTTEA